MDDEQSHRPGLQREEFYKELPWLKEAEARRKAQYEAFMRERGFEP